MAAVTCQEIRELFSVRVDDALTPEERARVDAHLAACAECTLEWQRFAAAVDLLRGVEPARAPAGFVDRVLAARPQRWYRRLVRGALVPWPVKVPLDAAAIVLIAGLAVMLFRHSPEIQRAARLPEAPVAVPTRPEAEAPVSPSSTLLAHPAPPDAKASGPAAPPSARERAAPNEPTAPAKRDSALADDARHRETKQALTELRKEQADSRDSARSDEAANLFESPAQKVETPASGARQSAERDGRRPVPPAAATAPPAAALAPQASGEVQRLSTFRIDVHARLAVVDREAAERAVRDLVGRAGGRVLARADETGATVLVLAVPSPRWEEVRGGLQSLGALSLEGRGDEAARQLVFTLRLVR